MLISFRLFDFILDSSVCLQKLSGLDVTPHHARPSILSWCLGHSLNCSPMIPLFLVSKNNTKNKCLSFPLARHYFWNAPCHTWSEISEQHPSAHHNPLPLILLPRIAHVSQWSGSQDDGWLHEDCSAIPSLPSMGQDTRVWAPVLWSPEPVKQEDRLHAPCKTVSVRRKHSRCC